MIKLIFIIITLILISCITGSNNISSSSDVAMITVWYDGCEYVIHPSGVAHKGNCRNTSHTSN